MISKACRVAVIGIALLLAIISGNPANAARTSKTNEAKLQTEIDSINLQLDFLKLKVSDSNKKTRDIERNVKRKRSDIEQLQKQVDQLSMQQIEISRQIDTLEARVKSEQSEIRRLLELYRQKLVQLHRIRQGTLLSSVFSAQSLNSFLNRYEMVKYLLQNDRKIIEDLKKHNLQQRKLASQLNLKKQQLENGKTELANRKKSLDGENKALQAMLQTVLLEKKLLLNREKSLAKARKELETEFAKIEKIRKDQNIDHEIEQSKPTTPAKKPRLGGERSEDASNAARVMDFSWPISKEKRQHVKQIESANSTSLQIFIAQDTEIYAAARGKVLYKGTISGLGNVIIIGHQRGFSTVYANLDDMWVGLGEIVEQKATIGKKTGGKAKNMHFEIRFGGRKQKPLEFLPQTG